MASREVTHLQWDSALSVLCKMIIEARQILCFSQTALQLNLLPANLDKNGW